MKDKITLKGGYVSVKMDDIHTHNMNTARGAGVHKSAKDYKRKPKHGGKKYEY